MADGRRYSSFLLRVWLVEDKDPPVWRASLEDTRSGERKGFASIEALVKFLREQTGPLTAPNQVGKEGKKV